MDSGGFTARATPLRTAWEFQCNESECIAALAFNQQRLLRRWSRSAVAITLLVLAIGAWFGVVVFGVGLAAESQDGSGWWFGGCYAGAVVVAFISRALFRRALLRWLVHGDGTLRSRRIVTRGEDGLRFRSDAGETFVAWDGIRSIEEHDRQILVYLDDTSFHLIPPSAFSDPGERAAFLAEIRARSAKELAQGALILTAPLASSDQAREEPPPRSGLAGNLLRGLRLALFLRPEGPGARPPDATWSSLVAMTSIGVALPLLSDLLQTGPNGSFFASGLPEAVFGLPVLVVAAWALARLLGRAPDTLPLLVALASLSIPIGVFDLFLHLAADGRLGRLSTHGGALSSVSSYLAPLWLTLAASIAAIRLLGAGARRLPAAILLTGLLVGLPMTAIDRHPTLWWAPREVAEEEAETARRRRTALANEDAFYLQPKLLEQQLAALKPGRRGVVDLYFIGMAAYAGQDVFMKEVQSVRKMFDERFDTAGRSLLLINNPATVSESPIATPTSLGLALKRVAEVMNRDEDILFLFITSHGSREHGASFDFFPLRLNPLEPARLKALLDQSGIQRRVVVVSACYSGAFVDALRDDKTLVISASAADRNSFGCSNDADFTYFGKAYFDEALRKTYSFSEAFELARPLIAERERKEHFSESGPRMFVGKSVQRALTEFVRLREAVAQGASRQVRRK